MDRVIIYAGQIPLADDLLRAEQSVMAGLGRFIQALLGTSTAVYGLACSPPTVPGLNVSIATGQIYSVQPLEATAYSDLPSDTGHTIVKQGHTDGVNFNTPAPGSAGNSINYLIEASYADSDTDLLLLPYYNSANPSEAFTGPGNSGAQQPTTRKGVCVLTLKAGASAPTGTQVTPTVDSGAVGLWVITVPFGATTITSDNITVYPGAPFLPAAGAARANAIATGIISLFYGASAPAGWGICDGSTYQRSDGTGTITTPDMRGRAAVGVSTDYALGTSFGSTTAAATTGAGGGHTPIGTGPAHTHSASGITVSNANASTGASVSDTTRSDLAGGGTQTAVSSASLTDPQHTHTATVGGSTGSAGSGALSMNAVPDHTHSVSVGTVQPSLALNYIMKL